VLLLINYFTYASQRYCESSTKLLPYDLVFREPEIQRASYMSISLCSSSCRKLFVPKSLLKTPLESPQSRQLQVRSGHIESSFPQSLHHNFPQCLRSPGRTVESALQTQRWGVLAPKQGQRQGIHCRGLDSRRGQLSTQRIPASS
jgi:hypothetical protein